MISSKDVDTAVILCGGLGVRLRPHTFSLPKPMINCDGRPFLHHIMAQLADQGIKDFILATGYLKEKIHDYFNDGAAFGWSIKYSDGENEWDTGRRIWEAKDILPPNFLLLYGDNFTLFNFKTSLKYFQKSTGLTLLVTKKERGEYKTSGNVKIRQGSEVQAYSKSPNCKGFDYVEIGYMLMNRDTLFAEYTDINCNLSEVMTSLAEFGKVNAVISTKPYFWMTDLSSWKQAEQYLIKVSKL